MDWDNYNYNDVLKVKIDIPDALMDMHMKWHEETAENGGRSIPAGGAGSGLEFLQFHRQFISCVKDWWQSENGTETPWPWPWWNDIPAALRVPAVYPDNPFDADWESFVQTHDDIISNPGAFVSDDDLGLTLESKFLGGINGDISLHSYVHYKCGLALRDPFMGNISTSPNSINFYAWHTLIGAWWNNYMDAIVPRPPDPCKEERLALQDVVTDLEVSREAMRRATSAQKRQLTQEIKADLERIPVLQKQLTQCMMRNPIGEAELELKSSDEHIDTIKVPVE